MSASASPDISVIIVNYNGARWLDRCLPALLGSAPPRTEVIVVDNASSDGSREMLARYTDVRVVALDENQGFAGGNNAGARVARGEWLAFLNNDTQARAGWLEALREPLQRDRTIALASARLVYMHDPSIIDSAGDGWTRWGGAFKRGHGRAAQAFEEAGEVFGACGAAFMVRRSVFEEIGGFDADFFLAFEDVDLSYRARLLGYRCVYVPTAIVEHAGSASLGRLSEAAVSYGQRNLEWVYFINTPWPLLLRTLPGHLLMLLAASAYFLRAGRLRAFLGAKVAALAAWRSVLAKRAVRQRGRRVSARALWQAMEPSSLALKWREKRFDMSVRATS
jgi:N-acetylglucosaminyl-diphospho-decaprenol L-rhamnosyltransferase